MPTTTTHGNGVTVTTSGGAVSIGTVGNGAAPAVVIPVMPVTGLSPSILPPTLPQMRPHAAAPDMVVTADVDTSRGPMAMQILQYGTQGSNQFLDVILTSATEQSVCQIRNNPELAAQALRAGLDLANGDITVRDQGSAMLTQTVVPAIMNVCSKPRER